MKFELSQNRCEVISYFMLHSLVNGTVMSDFFTHHLSSIGLNAVSKPFVLALRTVDLEPAREMDEKGIEPVPFAFSWITVILVPGVPTRTADGTVGQSRTEYDGFDHIAPCI
jgi:hypothetical protein